MHGTPRANMTAYSPTPNKPRGRVLAVKGDLFVDTSAWYPLVVGSLPEHVSISRGCRERIEAGSRVVTTNLVVAESHALLLRRTGIRAVLAFVWLVRQPPNVIVESTAEMDDRAVTEWRTRFRDQPFSMVDAVSFVVMTERGIADALPLDHRFAIAGF